MKYTSGQIRDMKKLQGLRRQLDRLKLHHTLQNNFGVYPPMMSKSQIRAIALKNGIKVPPNSTKGALVSLLAAHLAVNSKNNSTRKNHYAAID